MNRQGLTSLAVACAFAVCLAGCGGGSGGTTGAPTGNSGGGSSSSSSSSSAISATVSGAAAKGLLLNAPVAFYAVANGAAGTTAIGTTRTDSASGTFSSPVSANGPVVIAVSTDGSTEMLDEISGTAITAPSGLILHAVFDSLTNLQPVSVTPLTELAYQIAKAESGGLTTANIDAANDAVSQAFLNGAPILSTPPIDLKNFATATVAEQAQAKLLTAFAIAANDGTATDSTGKPCSGTYAQNIVCMVGGLPALISVSGSGSATLTSAAGYLSAAYTALDSGAVNIEGGETPSSLGLDTVTTAESAFEAAFTKQNPLPGFASTGNPVADTKALVANIRTNILDQAATQTFGYAPTLTALENDYNTNVGPVVASTTSVLNDIHTAATLIQAGTVSYRNNCGYDPTTLGTDTSTALCAYGFYGSGRILLTVTMTGASTYSVQTQPLVADTAQCTNASNYVTGGCPVNSSVPALNSQATWDATGAESASFNGPYYVTGSGGQVTGALNFAEGSGWDASTGTGSISLSGQLSNGSGGVALTTATIANDSVIQVENLNRLSQGGRLITAGLPPIGVSGTVDIPAFTTNAFSYAAKVVMGTLVTDKSGAAAVPGSITVTGSIEQLANGVATPLFAGSVGVTLQGVASFDATQPVSSTNFFTAQAQVAGTLSLPGGRVLSVTASADASQLSPTPAQPDSASVTYSYTTPSGTAVLNASGQYDATNGYSGTITNNAGITIAVAKPVHGTLTGTITAGGTETATISGDFVYYSDDTSESLF